jgi:hypothetical protein
MRRVAYLYSDSGEDSRHEEVGVEESGGEEAVEAAEERSCKGADELRFIGRRCGGTYWMYLGCALCERT